MTRIAGIDLPNNKRIEIALTYIYGIGLACAQDILQKINVNPNTKVFQLSDDDIVNIRSILDSQYQVEGELRRLQSMNIKRLMEINCYRGKRHRIGLPLRGQRTRTNARTRRGAKNNSNPN